MKIRTKDELNDALDQESAWRKQELTNLFFALEGARDGYKNMHIRTSVALAYAHWEGFIKAASEIMIAYISAKKLKGKEASVDLQRSCILLKLGSLGEIKRSMSLNVLLDYIENELPEETLNLDPKKIVNTRSNLTSAVFIELMSKLGLRMEPYLIRTHKIDSLVGLRNAIAHGDRPSISAESASDYLHFVRQLIEDFKVDILNSITEERYRRPA